MSQITTHVLDTARGKPGAGIAVSLHVYADGTWQPVAAGITNDDGRIGDWLPTEQVLSAGTYEIRFDVADYFEGQRLPRFFPAVNVTFEIDGSGQHYHVPLLISPYGYSTYRGS